ncbi:MAG: hypothetical protein ABIF10_06535 [Candidatus Woesearchaeota archaeon]
MIQLLKEPPWFFGLDSRHIPSWFQGYDSYAQLAFFAITLMIALFALKIHKITRQREPKLISYGFFFISLSYFFWSLLNFEFFSGLGDFFCRKTSFCLAYLIVDLAIYIHMILFLAGLITLNYMALRIKSHRTYTLLLLIVLLVIFFSLKVLFFFYLLSSLLLVYISIHHFQSYLKSGRRSFRAFLMGVSFLMLFCAGLQFIVGLNSALNYVIGNIMELAAYFVILYCTVGVIRK